MRFTKMHALGNDFVFLDAWREPSILRRENIPELARVMCHRHEGVGADGLIVVSRPEGADAGAASVQMRIWNADGSPGGMCGNGARCACKLAVERGYVTPGSGGALRLRVAGFAGGRGADLLARVHPDPLRPGAVGTVEIDLGAPVLEPAKIPADLSRMGPRTATMQPSEQLVDGHVGVLVNVGNPHVVLFTRQDPDELVDRAGPSLESHPAFPERINVQAVRVLNPKRLELRTWERGAGRTRACGTGACAALVAAALTGRSERAATVSMLGGELEIAWPDPASGVLMTGSASHAFDGEWDDPVEDLCALLPECIPAVRTSRLLLRPYQPADLPDIERLMSFPEVSGNTRTWPVPYMPGDNEKFLKRVARSMVAGESCGWAVCDPETGRLIGSIGMRIERDIRTAEVGYCMLPESWGKGYATEALRALIGHAFGVLGLRKLFADYHATNVGSGRVLEKCGFTRAALRVGHGERAGVVHDVVQMDLLNPAAF